MEAYKLQIIETLVVLALAVTIKWLANKLIERVAAQFNYQKPRIKIIKKIISILLYLVGGALLFIIWGVDQSELLFFVSSVLTILGIAFVAQWSIISNITASLIIYFNHPVKIGDTITIMDKDFAIEGRVSDVGIIFIILKNAEGEPISIPNNVFMQKMIKKKNSEESRA
jgi:small-conductance mechanosensitive channel